MPEDCVGCMQIIRYFMKWASASVDFDTQCGVLEAILCGCQGMTVLISKSEILGSFLILLPTTHMYTQTYIPPPRPLQNCIDSPS